MSAPIRPEKMVKAVEQKLLPSLERLLYKAGEVISSGHASGKAAAEDVAKLEARGQRAMVRKMPDGTFSVIARNAAEIPKGKGGVPAATSDATKVNRPPYFGMGAKTQRPMVQLTTRLYDSPEQVGQAFSSGSNVRARPYKNTGKFEAVSPASDFVSRLARVLEDPKYEGLELTAEEWRALLAKDNRFNQRELQGVLEHRPKDLYEQFDRALELLDPRARIAKEWRDAFDSQMDDDGRQIVLDGLMGETKEGVPVRVLMDRAGDKRISTSTLRDAADERVERISRTRYVEPTFVPATEAEARAAAADDYDRFASLGDEEYGDREATIDRLWPRFQERINAERRTDAKFDMDNAVKYETDQRPNPAARYFESTVDVPPIEDEPLYTHYGKGTIAHQRYEMPDENTLQMIESQSDAFQQAVNEGQIDRSKGVLEPWRRTEDWQMLNAGSALLEAADRNMTTLRWPTAANRARPARSGGASLSPESGKITYEQAFPAALKKQLSWLGFDMPQIFSSAPEAVWAPGNTVAHHPMWQQITLTPQMLEAIRKYGVTALGLGAFGALAADPSAR